MKSNCFETLNQKIRRYAYHNSYGIELKNLYMNW